MRDNRPGRWPRRGTVGGPRPNAGLAARPTHPARYVGDLRRSAAASTFGPGAIADFRTPEGAPVSVVMPCIEEWQSWPQLEIVHDPRLEAKLGVTGFRLTPVPHDDEEKAKHALPGVRFPRWLQCPGCHALKVARNWSQDDGAAARFCPGCSGNKPVKERTWVVPVRFVIACDAGHLSDFRWETWITHDQGCAAGANGLRFETFGAGLSGLRVVCSKCSAGRPIEDAFNKEITSKWRCAGERPWLGSGHEDCDRPVKVVQRGASNLYFPLVHSSLLIPPWDSDIELRLSDRWADLLDAEDREKSLRRWISQGSVLSPPDVSIDRFVETVLLYAESRDKPQSTDLKKAEWDSLRLTSHDGSPEFQVRPESVPASLMNLCQEVVRVPRLRELRAITGFTRIIAPPSADDIGLARECSVARTDPAVWYPAVEVRGEGVFLTLDPEALAEWEQRPAVEARRARIWDAWVAEYQERYGDDAVPTRPLTARFLLAHTLAHSLMRQLSLESGYSSASLRERIFSGEYGAGVLVYTATADADGTLGGLERQGLSGRIGSTVRDAIRSLRWCSSDPLCITGAMMASNACNLAACHACMLAPETSCEEFNRFLDRALLVGTPQNPETGFFQPLLEHAE